MHSYNLFQRTVFIHTHLYIAAALMACIWEWARPSFIFILCVSVCVCVCVCRLPQPRWRLYVGCNDACSPCLHWTIGLHVLSSGMEMCNLHAQVSCWPNTKRTPRHPPTPICFLAGAEEMQNKPHLGGQIIPFSGAEDPGHYVDIQACRLHTGYSIYCYIHTVVCTPIHTCYHNIHTRVYTWPHSVLHTLIYTGLHTWFTYGITYHKQGYIYSITYKVCIHI